MYIKVELQFNCLISDHGIKDKILDGITEDDLRFLFPKRGDLIIFRMHLRKFLKNNIYNCNIESNSENECDQHIEKADNFEGYSRYLEEADTIVSFFLTLTILQTYLFFFCEFAISQLFLQLLNCQSTNIRNCKLVLIQYYFQDINRIVKKDISLKNILPEFKNQELPANVRRQVVHCIVSYLINRKIWVKRSNFKDSWSKISKSFPYEKPVSKFYKKELIKITFFILRLIIL